MLRLEEGYTSVFLDQSRCGRYGRQYQKLDWSHSTLVVQVFDVDMAQMSAQTAVNVGSNMVAKEGAEPPTPHIRERHRSPLLRVPPTPKQNHLLNQGINVHLGSPPSN